MRVRKVCGTAAALIVTSVLVAAQATPNFVGTWVIDPEKTAALRPPAAAGGAIAPGGRGGGGGMTLAGAGGGAPEWVIAQTASMLTISRALPDGSSQRHVYKLDGSESVNVNGRTTQKSKSTVAAGKITTTGTQTVSTDQGDVSSEFRELRWLDKDGAMIVETTRTVNGTARTSTTAYTRKR
jgi:hypothetical protein